MKTCALFVGCVYLCGRCRGGPRNEPHTTVRFRVLRGRDLRRKSVTKEMEEKVLQSDGLPLAPYTPPPPHPHIHTQQNIKWTQKLPEAAAPSHSQCLPIPSGCARSNGRRRGFAGANPRAAGSCVAGGRRPRGHTGTARPRGHIRMIIHSSSATRTLGRNRQLPCLRRCVHTPDTQCNHTQERAPASQRGRRCAVLLLDAPDHCGSPACTSSERARGKAVHM